MLARLPDAPECGEAPDKSVDPLLPCRYVVWKDVDQSPSLLDDRRDKQADQSAEGNDGSDDGEKERESLRKVRFTRKSRTAPRYSDSMIEMKRRRKTPTV